MHRRTFLADSLSTCTALLLAPASSVAATPDKFPSVATRADWLQLLLKIATPVLESAVAGTLQKSMPVEAATGHREDRSRVTHLEAVARTLSGIAPWLEHGPTSGEEGAVRSRFQQWALHAIELGTAPNSPAYLNFGKDRQTIVDAGFLSLALARAPHALVQSLSPSAKSQLAAALRATRQQAPPFNNWLLFAALIEAALHLLGEPWDRMRVDYALREHASWFLGDGVYGDGPHFHADYYNSFVIHPFLLALIEVLGPADPAWDAMAPKIRDRARRYAIQQERLIAPDGTYPIVGRSITYRCGAFHLLADIAHREALPDILPPEQVRCALSSVIDRTLNAPSTFDPQGWLRIGLSGHQPSLGETYISTGSLYLCTNAFLPLGLTPENRFWSAPPRPWSSQLLWSGHDLPADHALDD